MHLQLMNDYHVAHLPVVDADESNNYLGIISEEQLLQSDDENTLASYTYTDGTTSVNANRSFFKSHTNSSCK